MDPKIIATLFEQGGQLITECIKNGIFRQTKAKQTQVLTIEQQPEVTPPQEVIEGKASSIAAGCVPCAIGHLGTCSGVINEAVRFAKKDGVQSSEVIDRVNMCLDELNAMERVDLRPEMIVNLPEWESNLANQALVTSRSVRHELEGLSSAKELERTAANIQRTRTEIGRGWFKERLSRMPKEEKGKLVEQAIEKLEKE